MPLEVKIPISMPFDPAGSAQTQAALNGIAAQVDKVAASASAAGVSTGQFVDAAGRLKRDLTDASTAADSFTTSLKAGLSIDIGHRIVEGLAEIPAAFREAIAEGVKFNAEMENLAIGIAAKLRSVEPGTYLSFGAAREAGVADLSALQAKANELGLEFSGIAHSFAITLPSLVEAGVTSTTDQINILIRLSQIAQANGITGARAVKDILAELTGRGETTVFGKELKGFGITNASIKEARENGTLAQEILGKTAGYNEAAAASADTLTAAENRLHNATQQLYGEIAKPVFEALKQAYNDLAAEIAKPEVSTALRGLGYDIASIIEAGTGLVEFAIRNAEVLVPLATAVGLVSFALAAYKAAQIASIIGARLTTMVAETEATAAQTIAITEQTAAIGLNTDAKVLNAGTGVGGVAPTGIGAAGLVGNGILIAAAGAVGFAGGRAIQTHVNNQDAASTEADAQASEKRTDAAAAIRDQIAAADTAEKEQKAREDLAKLREKANADLQQVNALGGLGGEKTKETIADLQRIADALADIDRQFDRIKGKNPFAGDAKGKEQAEALERYQDSPEARLARAEATGDKDAAEKAKFDAAVARRAPNLEKNAGLSPVDAQFQAGYEISAADNQKAEEAANKKQEQEDKKAAAEKARDDEKARQDAERASADAKQRQDAIDDEQSQIAILRARAAGQDDLANKLERERDIRQAIDVLMRKGLGYGEAKITATDHIDAQNAAQDRKEAERDARHHERQERRRDNDKSLTIQGYHDPYVGEGLHTGGLTTGNLGGTSNSSAADALASAPSYVPTFPTRFSTGAGLLQQLNPPTASAMLAPVASALAPRPTVAAPGASEDSNTVDAAREALASGQQALSAARGATNGNGGSQNAGELGTLKKQFDQLKSQFDQLEQKVSNHAGQIADRS